MLTQQVSTLWLEPPNIIHLVPARTAGLLLAGNSFQISTGFHRRPSSRDSLKIALSRFPLLQGFCAPAWHSHEGNRLKVACSIRLSVAAANYPVWAKGDSVAYQRLASRTGRSLSPGDFTYWTLHGLKLPAGEKRVWFFLLPFGALLCCVPC